MSMSPLMRRQEIPILSLCNLCGLCVFVVNQMRQKANRRDIAQMRRTRAWMRSVPPRGSGWVGRKSISSQCNPQHTRYREVVLTLSKLAVLLLFIIPPVFSRTQSSAPHPTGVLRLRVRVKLDDATKGLSRKRFYLIKGSLEQNKAVLDAAAQQPIVSRDCFYSKLGASQALIDWLKAGDCESVYCREVAQDYLTGPKAVPEFANAYAAGEKELAGGDVGRKWITNNLPAQLRDGFYQDRRHALQALIKQAEALSTTAVLSVMTDRNGTAYFTDLEPGTYVLTNFLPIEIGQTATSWNCEVQIKPGDIATEKPYLISNKKDKNVRCIAVEKPLPVCNK